MADTHNEAELKRNYPVTSGLEEDEKHEGRVSNLIPMGNLGKRSTVRSIERTGL